MLIEQQFVFTLLNFGIFIGLIIYLYYRYGKPMLLNALAAKEHERKLLKLEKQSLIDEKQRLSSIIEQEHRFAALLLERAIQWKQRYQQERAHELEQQRAIEIQLEAKRNRQAQLYAQQRLYKKIFPQVMAQAREQLREQFSGPEAGQAYIKDITHFMNKSIR